MLQIGIGAVPEAITRRLRDRRDLGVHSGMLGEGLVDLVESGAVTNARKPIDRGVSVTGLLIGTRRLFGFAHRNTAVALRDGGYTSDPAVLARLDRLVTINSALEVDLTGQVNAEQSGPSYLGGTGGQADFVRAGPLPRRTRHHRAARHGPGRHDQPDHGPAVRPGDHGADRGGRDRDRVRRGRAEGAVAGRASPPPGGHRPPGLPGRPGAGGFRDRAAGLLVPGGAAHVLLGCGGDLVDRPVLLRLQAAGHLTGSLDQAIEQTTDWYAFLFDQLGLGYYPVSPG